MDDLKQISFEEYMEVCEMAADDGDEKGSVRKATQADIDAFKYS